MYCGDASFAPQANLVNPLSFLGGQWSNIKPTHAQGLGNVFVSPHNHGNRLCEHRIFPNVVFWADVEDVGPTSKQYWVNISC